jgi:hypothetical protein
MYALRATNPALVSPFQKPGISTASNAFSRFCPNSPPRSMTLWRSGAGPHYCSPGFPILGCKEEEPACPARRREAYALWRSGERATQVLTNKLFHTFSYFKQLQQ